MPQFDRWQAAILSFCALLVLGGTFGLLSARSGDVEDPDVKRTLAEYYAETQKMLSELAISAENAQSIALEAVPDRGDPINTKFEGDIWEVKFSDDTEVKIDVNTGEIVEIEYDD